MNTSNRHIIKVCGMRDADNIRAVEALGIDLMGFIFWPSSSRYVSQRPAYLPTQCRRAGVFVDEAVDVVKSITSAYALDVIQLHGHESPEYVRQLAQNLHPKGVGEPEVIKAFNIATKADLQQTVPYENLVDAFLFDTKGKSVGGNGEKFDWSVLQAYNGATPFLLSGGIGPGDAARIQAFNHPQCIGIDLNSKFEVAPGLKDVAALRDFMKSMNI